MIWPKAPSLPSEVMQELELHGVDAVRGLLTASTDGYHGTGRPTPFNLGNVVVTRAQIQDWLKWKAAKESIWIKSGVIAAIAAAIFSFVGLLK